MRLPTLVRGILLWIVRDFPELQPDPGEARNPASDVTLAFRAPKLEGVRAPVYTLLTFDSGLGALRFLTRSSPGELARFHRAFYQAMDIAPGQAPEIAAKALQEPPGATTEAEGKPIPFGVLMVGLMPYQTRRLGHIILESDFSGEEPYETVARWFLEYAAWQEGGADG